MHISKEDTEIRPIPLSQEQSSPPPPLLQTFTYICIYVDCESFSQNESASTIEKKKMLLEMKSQRLKITKYENI
jgi:hypothetical protein